MLYLGFNRDIVECKVFIAVTAPRAGADLIETLWNVKLPVVGFPFRKGLRFNRDIVECKEVFRGITVQRRNRFNRDIVECKGKMFDTSWMNGFRFNRDIVECKDWKPCGLVQVISPI